MISLFFPKQDGTCTDMFALTHKVKYRVRLQTLFIFIPVFPSKSNERASCCEIKLFEKVVFMSSLIAVREVMVCEAL